MKYFRIAIGLFMILSGIKAIQEVYNGLDDGFLVLEYIPLALLMVFTLGAFLTDRYHYQYQKKLYEFLTSAIGFLFCGFVLFKLIHFKFIDYSTTVLEVRNLPGANNVLKFEFKGNNQFRLVEYNILGQTVFYGRYEKQQDTLYIGKNNYKGYAKALPSTGVINTDTMYWNKFDTMLVERK